MSAAAHVSNSTVSCGHTSDSASVFGSLSDLNTMKSSLSILFVVAAVIVLNRGFHNLHCFTEDTPFEALITAIEHELMIVGSTAFLFKIVTNSTNFIAPDWRLALEFADFLIPFVAISFCIQGLLLIFILLLQTNMWKRGYHSLLEELLDEYYDVVSEPRSSTNKRFFVASKIKFRTYNIIFCETHGIVRDSLSFDEYVQLMYEKYLKEVIEIRVIDWAFVVILLLMNWARAASGVFNLLNKCNQTDPYLCEVENEVWTFVVLGFTLFGVLLLFAIVTYIYHRALLTSRGILDINDCVIYLKCVEDANLEAANCKSKFRLDRTAVEGPRIKKTRSMWNIALEKIQKTLHKERDDDKCLEPTSSKTSKPSINVSSKPPSFKIRTKSWPQSNKNRVHSKNDNDIAVTAYRSFNVGANRSREIIVRTGRLLGSLLRFTKSDNDNSDNANVTTDIKSNVDIEMGIQSNSEVKNSSKSDESSHYSDAQVLFDDSSEILLYEPCSVRFGQTPNEPHTRVGNSTEEMCILNNIISRSSKSSASKFAPVGTEVFTGGVSDSTGSRSIESGAVRRAFDKVLSMRTPVLNWSNGIGLGDDVAATYASYSNKLDRRGQLDRDDSYTSPYDYKKPDRSVNKNPLGVTDKERERMIEMQQVGSWPDTDLASIFWLSYPELYFSGVKWLIIAQSLFLGLWFVNFLPIILGLADSMKWLLLTLMISFGNLCLYIYIINFAAQLKSMSCCDTEVIAQVVEQTKSSDLLATSMRSSILARLQSMCATEPNGDPVNELKHLFEELDNSCTGYLGFDAFEIFLQDMGLQHSLKSWERMFKRIDRDQDRKVTLDDLFMFLFPDHPVAKAEENVRVRILQSRIRRNSSIYTKQHGNNDAHASPPVKPRKLTQKFTKYKRPLPAGMRYFAIFAPRRFRPGKVAPGTDDSYDLNDSILHSASVKPKLRSAISLVQITQKSMHRRSRGRRASSLSQSTIQAIQSFQSMMSSKGLTNASSIRSPLGESGRTSEKSAGDECGPEFGLINNMSGPENRENQSQKCCEENENKS